MDAKEFARVYHSKTRVDFVQGLRCCVCWKGPCENHHIRNGGMGRKANYKAIVPLCFDCHQRYHQIGKLSILQWANKHGGLKAETPTSSGVKIRHYDQFDDVAKATQDLWVYCYENVMEDISRDMIA